VTGPHDVMIEAGHRSASGQRYALATVVRVDPPASTRPGDKALVTAEGGLVGWIGGACSEPAVIRLALRTLAEGTPRVLRIGPPGSGADVESACASEGTVEVLIEPVLPAPLLAVVGESLAALTLARLARTIGWRVVQGSTEGADAVLVATMGRGDEDALVSALAGGAGYVGLVASARRAAVVARALRERGVCDEAIARVRSPAGLDLGRVRQEEIAVAVLAELVAWRAARPAARPIVAEAVDPVCGMTVTLAGVRETAVHEGVTYAFCCAGCRQRFEADPTRYLTPA
jgi:xanthine dehydrogenase accessory factor